MSRELLQQALDALEFPHDSEWSNKAKAIEALQHALTQPEKKEQRMTDEQLADWSYKMQIACNKSTSDSDINIIKLIQHIENLYEQGRADERELAKPESHIVKWSIPVDPNNFGEPLAQPEQENEAYSYAKRLAEFIWKEHYKEESPDWTPLPDVLGVLTQIDNMTCGLEKAKPEMPTKIFGPNLEQILNAAGFYRREWVGLTDEEIKEVLDLNVAPWSLSGVALQHVMDDARALEAKLKEKNGG